MKTATCGADMITLQDGRVLLSVQYCQGDDCKEYPCDRVRRWAKRHGVLDQVKTIRKKCDTAVEA